MRAVEMTVDRIKGLFGDAIEGISGLPGAL